MNIVSNPSNHDLPHRLADFATLAEALDYAASGATGFDFYDSRGRLREAMPYSALRRRARSLARRLLGTGLSRGDRIAAVAETDPEFAVLFFACQYAGLIPVALPISLNLGGHAAYVEQLRRLLVGIRPALALAPTELLPFLEEASEGLPGLAPRSFGDLAALPEADIELHATEPDEIAYLQFTSGSTRFPRGVIITESTVMSNLRGIVRQGLGVRPGDRCVSWLPFYHDMGLVGFLLGPMVSQVSVDYLRTRDFAVRPVQWLKLISRNRATIAFGPPIAFQLCDQRLRADDLAELDLSTWRIAGVGAEMIRLGSLERFAQSLKPAGFDPRAFLPCYGLAESSLAVAFSPVGGGVLAERVDADALSDEGVAVLAEPDAREIREVVNCGRILPEHEVVIRDEAGASLGYRRTGRVTLRGPSVMSGYFDDPQLTKEVLTEDGWLETGDLGYMTEDGLFVTGRSKDLIIINGRNIWPQDLEYLAEQQQQVRIGDASAFAVADPDGVETAVLVVQCRISDVAERDQLKSLVQSSVYGSFGVHCLVDLVPPRTLPKTSSGKLSRDAARRGFLERVEWDEPLAVAEAASTA
ncbi:MAG: fatty acyl-AMP ligase [Gemmatimonadota bacterium]|nr:MAG: fatty acyl-AMP ligase [Gemmatimonadota bacterium]